MEKVLKFPTQMTDNNAFGVINEVRGYLKPLKENLDSLIEYHRLKELSQQALFRGCSMGQLMELADVVLPVLNRADLLLEVLELNLLNYASQTESGEPEGEVLELLNDVVDARTYYVDDIAGKAFDAFDREMRPYRKLGGTPLFSDADN